MHISTFVDAWYTVFIFKVEFSNIKADFSFKVRYYASLGMLLNRYPD